VSSQRKLVIFDWDDTIFPTTAMYRNREKVSGAELERFGKRAFELLVKYIEAFSAENIFLVTNGNAQWVEESLDFLSSQQLALSGYDYWALIRQLLASHLRGHVISARSLFERAFPKQTMLWKKYVFQRLAITHFAGSDAQSECVFVSIGDSSDEFVAALETQKMFGIGEHSAGHSTEQPLVHLIRIKLQRAPTRDVMLTQFDVLRRCSCTMAGRVDTSFDIEFEKKEVSGLSSGS